MRKNILKIAILLLFSNVAFSQVGINTETPKATLDIVGKPTDNKVPDGVIAPKLTGAQLKAKDHLYDTNQTGAIIYISEALSSTDTTSKTKNVTAIGYYFFDGSKWVGLRSSFKSNIYTSDGSLKSERLVNLNDHNLIFSGNGNVGIGGVDNLAKLNVTGLIQFAPNSHYGLGKVFDDATGEKYGITQSTAFPSSGSQSSLGTRIYTSGSTGVPGHISFGKYTGKNTYTEWGRFNHTDGKFGLNTTDPQAKLDVEGTMRLGKINSTNTPNRLNGVSQMYINQSDGLIAYAPTGFARVAGGFRPMQESSNYLIYTFPATNTIAKVHFIWYIDGSSSLNNSQGEAYNYGEFTIVGMGTSNPIKIIDFKLKDYLGQVRSFTMNSAQTEVSWSNYSQKNVYLKLNQASGKLEISNELPDKVFSVFFEILGGI